MRKGLSQKIEDRATREAVADLEIQIEQGSFQTGDVIESRVPWEVGKKPGWIRHLSEYIPIGGVNAALYRAVGARFGVNQERTMFRPTDTDSENEWIKL